MKFWKKPPPEPPKDSRLTEQELAEMESLLRSSIQTLVRKVRFIDKETKQFLQEEDMVSLANDGIDALMDEFKDYIRTRVKPHGTAS